MHLEKAQISQSRLEDLKSADIKLSPEIKREPRSQSNRLWRRRLRSPVLLNDGRRGFKPKRSRLSSPVVVKDDEDRATLRFAEQSRGGRPESSSRVRSPRNRGRRLRDSHHFTDDRHVEWGKRVGDGKPAAKKPKEQPNFELSGKLAADTNTYKGVVIKYNEPEDARKPTSFWRLYPFKGNEALKVMHIHRQSGYLIGSAQHIADLPMAHPSISKQHAVLQFRFTKGRVRLYVIDLESTNGTFLNNKKIEPRRYYELREKDVLKFGYSTREYVVMTDQVATESDKDE
ncbi:Smad nuclear-interacting protein 1 [Echinococcus granulosus]|uniref:Smad nuclear interacting protein 1 n=1 Tax=Echinococcus granulosus TaxID=6210 RepID=U6JC17_ECHGR|nr:Smad nuclear-interacting protein [Echinococcus granulosus]EUB56483.1 Smad nuclear-interacting protein [Echinococcus granulosus]KAH9284532.1 Smad nuclear-interacting protein 1 [Echinococcus granulosus]CDS19998.1 Smad nuclear interacting protein 1 [Echinococcus granulosus]